jgi:hypothetical protein
MTIPSIIFGIAIGGFLGAGFHFWRGGSSQRLMIYLMLAQFGFWGGHYLASYLGWTFAPVGPLQVGMGVIGAAFVLILADVLGRIELPTGSE